MADAGSSTPESAAPASQQASKEAPSDAKPEGLAEKAAAAGKEDAPPEPKKHVPNPKVREFAALTKKEREVRALMAQQRQEAAEIAELRKLREQSKRNPDAWLKAGGLTYDELTDHYVSGGDKPASPRDQELEQGLAAARKEVAELRAAMQKKEEDRAVSNYIDDIKKTAQTEPSFELVRHYEAYVDVYELIDLHYQETGEILDKAEACRQIEDILFEMKSEEGKKLLSASKLRQKFGLADPAAERTDDSRSSPESTAKPTATGAKTLTSELAASAGANPPPSKPLTDDERWEALLARARAEG